MVKFARVLHTRVGGPSTWKEEQTTGWMSVSALARGHRNVRGSLPA